MMVFTTSAGRVAYSRGSKKGSRETLRRLCFFKESYPF